MHAQALVFYSLTQVCIWLFGTEIINGRLSEVCLPTTSLYAAATPGALEERSLHIGYSTRVPHYLSVPAYPTSVADNDMIT